ncbi:hypothetical protein DI273_30695 [Streptomyces violascens]|nr:hypothetical protein DI273_30695 [Streptomyces violascens]
MVTGEQAALDALVARCEAEGARVRRIPVDYASHSPQVDQVADRIGRELAGVSPRTASVPVYSTVEAAWWTAAGWTPGTGCATSAGRCVSTRPCAGSWRRGTGSSSSAARTRC